MGCSALARARHDAELTHVSVLKDAPALSWVWLSTGRGRFAIGGRDRARNVSPVLRAGGSAIQCYFSCQRVYTADHVVEFGLVISAAFVLCISGAASFVVTAVNELSVRVTSDPLE
jgi:hypothetical protein